MALVQTLDVGSPYVHAMAGFSKQSCSGGVLIWSVPTPRNGLPSAETSLVLNLTQMPFDAFKIEVFSLDDSKAAGVRILLMLLDLANICP